MLSKAKHLAASGDEAVDQSPPYHPNPARAATFERLCQRVRRCRACDSMHHVHVLSEANGPLDADALFVAEAPGRVGAARTGVPMTSDVTGRRFESFLEEARLLRESVFVTNAVLCNPLTPGGLNRRPGRGEVAECNGFLGEQLELVRAPLVVALGTVALDALRQIEPHDFVLARDIGRAVSWAGRTLVPLYHPSVQSTLTRPHEQQLADWRALGRLMRAARSLALKRASAYD
jgi:DNA polymerase